MPEIIVYLLKVNLAVILFYLGYRFLLRRLTFYTLNRFYLLFSLVFSFSYPLVDVAGWLARSEQAMPAEMIYVIPDWRQVPTETFDWWAWVVGLLVIGSAWFTVRLAIRLLSLWQIHRQSQPALWQWFNYRQVFRDILPFSFWRHIYVNVDHHEQRDLLEIFKHEQIHVDEVHTLDVLLAEIGTICTWFNPGIWLLRTAIHENLEFITDRKVLSSGVDKKVYQYSLLSIGQQTGKYPAIGNGFNFKSLKKRIMMMNKGRSSRVNLGRYLLVLPVIAVFVLVFTVSRAYELKEDAQGGMKVKQDTLVPEKKPLILVDGEAYDGNVNDLDPSTIESIDVLKNKAATEKYGSKGKDGVVLITLKEGQKIQLKADSTKRYPEGFVKELQSSDSTGGQQPLVSTKAKEAAPDLRSDTLTVIGYQTTVKPSVVVLTNDHIHAASADTVKLNEPMSVEMKGKVDGLVR